MHFYKLCSRMSRINNVIFQVFVIIVVTEFRIVKINVENFHFRNNFENNCFSAVVTIYKFLL